MRRLIILVLLISVSITQAQTDTPNESWEIVERCISEPTAPSDDWSYDGIVFMYSFRAVHGLNANIPTPYIIAYNTQTSIFAWNGAISPDGAWFAVPEGLRSSGGLIVYHYEIDHIQVYSTDGRREQHSIAVESGISVGSDIPYSYVGIPQWLNDEEFVYPVFGNTMERLNPFTNIREIYEDDYSPIFIRFQNIISQDDERWIISQETINEAYNVSVIDNLFETTFAARTNTTLLIGDTETQTFTDLCIRATGIAFSPNGEFVISTGEEILLIDGENTYRLAYHDGTVFDWRFPEN